MLTILFSALFAGIVAALVTVAIEKWGGVVGGILGTLPTTIVPATIGMYLEGGSEDLATSMSLIPFWMLLNALFVGAWVAYPRIRGNVGIKEMTSVSLIFWIITALVMTFVLIIALDHYSKSVIGLTGLSFLIVLGVWMTFNPRNAPSGKNKVSKQVLLVRGLAAATAIGIAVQLSSMGQPVIAGLASVFPAIFLTTMVALWMSQGPEVPTGAAGPMMLGGSSVAVYSLLAPWALPEFGIIVGTLVCWFGSVISTSIPAYSWITWRNQTSQ
ncbi:MAG: hypothetical protein ACKVHH_03920 [Candidatus Poseidoniales archaeon]|jgi:hypothetical protein|tara:strand:+ start:88 stop:900 length:813 start_codon:yes stop_codon:yes gene_type:complete